MDHKDFKSSKDFRPNNDSGLGKRSVRWWAADENMRGGCLSDTGKALKDQQGPRSLMNLIHARLYGNFDMSGLGPGTYASQMSVLPYQVGTLTSRVAFNVIASCVETLAAKIGKNKPIPTFLTSGGVGGWKMQQKARNLTRFVKGLFYETDIHALMVQKRFDDYIFGTGIIYLFINGEGKVEAERVFPDELYVDDADGMYRKPKQMIRRRVCDRDQVLADFGDTAEKREAIMNAKLDATERPVDSTADLVEIWEGWHLRSKKGAKDGRYIASVGSMALCDEEYKLDRFPFVISRYVNRTLGFWGQGIAEKLTGIQIELNYTVRSISQQIRRKGKGRYFAPYGSINPNQMDNSVAPIVLFKGGVPPTPDNGNTIAPEEFQQVDRLKQQAYQEVGISELSAQAKKPSGLDAAVALREFNDIETERFALAAQQHETDVLDFTELALDLIRDSGAKGYKVRLPNKRYVIELDWKDINLERDEYAIQMFPVSSLPSTPAARLQRVEELRGAGYIDMPTAKALLDYPDIEAELNLGNAARDDVDACISMILDEATPEAPIVEPYQNLELIVTRGTEAYLFAKHHGAEEERLQMLRAFIDNASSTIESQVKAMTAQAVPGAGAPPPSIGPEAGGNPVNVNVEAAPPAPSVPPVVA